ncbi:hypothetical protein DFK10_08830 [Salibaculum griseiflavum]|uniref:Uncharacterized protein n=1 Tax=Salibaculum griseiflavum TaxID=1914409 RepID=A0A2V1P7C7_9RHOB|nr:hypothetical protein DFK10_08830 [Salibaculum griseiflavum]
MFKMAQSLITEIIRIDNQNRALAKVSIVATDVHNASSDGLDLSDEEIYHLRTGLKMDMLRDHLKTYLSESFDYISSDRVKARLKQSENKKNQSMENEVRLGSEADTEDT